MWANEREGDVGSADFKRNIWMKQLTWIVLIACVMSNTCSAYAVENNNTQVGRYLIEKDGAEISQINPLKQTFSVTFPSNVYRVKEAMTYLLINSGYNLAPNIQQTVSAKNLLSQKLPLSDRHMGPMTIQEGLMALSGNTYQLLIDPERRLISFRLKKPFESLYIN